MTTAPQDVSDVVAILSLDRELAAGVPAGEREVADRELRLPACSLDPGPVVIEDLDLPDSTLALLVVEGELTSDIAIDGHALTEMLCPGDLIPRWEPDLDDMEVDRYIVAKTPVRLAVLDAEFVRAAARWPRLLVTVHRRLADQQHRLSAMGAICQMPRVEDRLVAMLRHLGTRNGRLVPGGRVVPVPLTHEALGRLVGARRPTITLAVKQLETDGRLERRPDGTWLLPGQ